MRENAGAEQETHALNNEDRRRGKLSKEMQRPWNEQGQKRGPEDRHQIMIVRLARHDDVDLPRGVGLRRLDGVADAGALVRRQSVRHLPSPRSAAAPERAAGAGKAASEAAAGPRRPA